MVTTVVIHGHTAGPARGSEGTAKKYCETLTAFSAKLDASVALLDGSDGSVALTESFRCGVHHRGAGDLRPASVRAALGGHPVAHLDGCITGDRPPGF